ncbi:MAG: hypothetical protein PHX94_03330 [Bacteroidales bacterium]|nr:hypothetical protein [Bacteroidales bacterium]
MSLIFMGFAFKFTEQAATALKGCDSAFITKAVEGNPWFIPEFVRHRLDTLRDSLEKETGILGRLLDMEIPEHAPRMISIVAAGNIPLVCWHDFVCALAYAAAHPRDVVLEVKLSSRDQVLLPAIVERLGLMKDSCLAGVLVRFVKQVDPGTQAILFTGGSQASLFYRRQFPATPMLLRTSRSSVALLNGSETPSQLDGLAQDCFLYFGLGCRNVSLMLVPRSYNFHTFITQAASVFRTLLHNHSGYRNALRHARACFMMTEAGTPQGGALPDFFILKESDQLNPPMAVLHYLKYQDLDGAVRFIEQNKDYIQCVSGTPGTPLGQTQHPLFTDYADGLNTLEWLQKLSS